jgi:hypothetical protein
MGAFSTAANKPARGSPLCISYLESLLLAFWGDPGLARYAARLTHIALAQQTLA